jgi:hypothetical protein
MRRIPETPAALDRRALVGRERTVNPARRIVGNSVA